ncbi:exonuclease V a 5' deoxyribonuclease-domain-containing protein [Coniella lustricola]|uniref:Exonuclease V a 5' deoxyribonuclease-domain-containing protein n=1 Tax=Coniella lustricola TaxID=2025994 RepID=A0A2T3ABV5_9PEZI|nr:exonuclease V a 5' deoxyribonuclease-domain-containing protein [Coniella lustricola]
MASVEAGDSTDDDFGYDLSLEDEKLLASLADRAPHSAAVNTTTTRSPTTAAPGFLIRSTTASQSDKHVDGVPRSSPSRAKTALLGVGRTDSINNFVRSTQPDSSCTVIPADDLNYPDLTRDVFTIDSATAAAVATTQDQTTPNSPAQEGSVDSRSPLLRLRTFPMKPLSVSDLTAGAWCELQYEYVLTRLPGGRRTTTEAMKGGSKVHKKLEDQVYETVKIEITRREDAFGLKVWNIIQGLRVLRATGLTREFEVWGLVDGNVVNGLIDHLSYDNPDPKFEKEWIASQESQTEGDDGSQEKITDFFPSGPPRPKRTRRRKIPKVYLSDVKTRGAKNLPKDSAIRPTKVQLHLYHRFLSDMAANKLDYLQVFQRYGLDVDAPFSDSFLSQIEELHDDVFHDSGSVVFDNTPTSPGSDSHVLLKYRTLRELIPLLQQELSLTFTEGAASVGSVVSVEYRLRGEEDSLIGTVCLAVDSKVLTQYLDGYMEWWKGERSPRGVDIEEAYKCSHCEFAEICSWRKEIDMGFLKRAREKMTSRVPIEVALDSAVRTKSKSPRGRRKKNAVAE